MNLLGRCCALVALPATIGLGLGVAPVSVSGQARPEQVTTDTPQYCLQRLDRISALARGRTDPPQEVADLSSEGQRMCDQGQTRGGILRLRRALVLLQGNAGH